MAADILGDLLVANLAAAAAILVLTAVRKPLRRAFGARLAYAAWLIAPLAGLATFLPGLPAAPGAAPTGEIFWVIVQSAAPRADLTPALLVLWLAGAALGIGLVVHRQWRTLSLIGPLSKEGENLVRAKSPAIGPALTGLIAARIILPADFETRFTAREQALILAHERAHMAAWDVRINALIALCRCLFWFNPLVHIASGPIREDQELACDETVVRAFPRERRAYAEALLKTQVPSAPLPLGCYWPSRSPQRLKERLTMLTKDNPSGARRALGWTLVATLAAGLGCAAWAAAPQDSVNLSNAQEDAGAEAGTGGPALARRDIHVRRITIGADGEPVLEDLSPDDAEGLIHLNIEDGDHVRYNINRDAEGGPLKIWMSEDSDRGELELADRAGGAVIFRCRALNAEDPICDISGNDEIDLDQLRAMLGGTDLDGKRLIYRLNEE